jgi:glycosyltransferase involved in cell wall biosynthesis
VLTLHDVLFRRRPELLGRAMRWGTEAMVVPAARRADRVVTGAAAARDDIVAELGVRPDRIDVVPHGVAAPGRGEGARARARFDLGERPVVLSVATELPHKNLGALIDGLALLAPGERPLLVCAGHGTDGGSLARRAAGLGVDRDVRLLGGIAAGELEDLYRTAAMLVTATLYEGFGLPVIEAMARGVPVACSDLPVLREVAGEDALWLDPCEPPSIAEAIRRAVSGGPELARLAGAGPRRAARFTWRASAEATAASYDRALERGPRRRRRASA